MKPFVLENVEVCINCNCESDAGDPASRVGTTPGSFEMHGIITSFSVNSTEFSEFWFDDFGVKLDEKMDFPVKRKIVKLFSSQKI